MPKTANVLVIDKQRIRNTRMRVDHRCLYDRKTQKRYAITAPSYTGTGRLPVYIVGEQAAQTLAIGRDGSEVEVHGETVTVEDNRPQDVVVNGELYRITPQLMTELVVSEDLRGLGLAIGAQRLQLFLAAGAGAGALVVLYLLLNTAQGWI